MLLLFLGDAGPIVSGSPVRVVFEAGSRRARLPAEARRLSLAAFPRRLGFER